MVWDAGNFEKRHVPRFDQRPYHMIVVCLKGPEPKFQNSSSIGGSDMPLERQTRRKICPILGGFGTNFQGITMRYKAAIWSLQMGYLGPNLCEKYSCWQI